MAGPCKGEESKAELGTGSPGRRVMTDQEKKEELDVVGDKGKKGGGLSSSFKEAGRKSCAKKTASLEGRGKGQNQKSKTKRHEVEMKVAESNVGMGGATCQSPPVVFP